MCLRISGVEENHKITIRYISRNKTFKQLTSESDFPSSRWLITSQISFSPHSRKGNFIAFSSEEFFFVKSPTWWWVMSRHLIMTKEEELSTTQFFGPLSGGAVLKVWSKDINWLVVFFSNAIGKKQRLYFFPFHTFSPVDVVVKRTQSWRDIFMVCVVIAFFKNKWIKVIKRTFFFFMFHLHSCSYFLFLLRSIQKKKFKNYTFRHELEDSSENFC